MSYVNTKQHKYSGTGCAKRFVRTGNVTNYVTTPLTIIITSQLYVINIIIYEPHIITTKNVTSYVNNHSFFKGFCC